MELRGTTILAVLTEAGVAVAGDGQVTLGQAVAMKHGARKVRRIYNGKVVVGFAGATADAFTLLERFEAKLEEFGGNLVRASVELAKDWRKDKYCAGWRPCSSWPTRAMCSCFPATAT